MSVASDKYCYNINVVLLSEQRALWEQGEENKDAEHYVNFSDKKDLNPFTDNEQVPRDVEDEVLTNVWEGSNELLPFHVFDAFSMFINSFPLTSIKEISEPTGKSMLA